MIIRTIISIILTCAYLNAQAQVSIITTIAGKGTQGYSGDNGLAINAEIYFPSGLCMDNFENIYIADAFNHAIRKINISTGIITTIAGTGNGGFNGDNIAATSAELAVPGSVCTDSIGNVYVADGINHRIRKIDVSTGVITTIAGTGSQGYGGDGGPAINAKLNGPGGVSMDKNGNIYIADYWNERIRKIEASTGLIYTIAGIGVSGYSGDSGPATNAKISTPGQAFSDSYGNVFFTEVNNSTVRKVDAITGIITTVAGDGTQGYTGDNGPSENAKLNKPFGIFIDSVNNIYIDEWGNGTIRKIEGLTGIITTVAGTGTQGFSGDGGPATNAMLKPDGVWVDKFGTIFIADIDNNRIRKIYNPKLGINLLSTDNKVSVYPNPADNEITIEYSFRNKQDAILQITDIAGRVVITKTLQSNKQKEEIDIHAFSQGLYLYKVTQNDLPISTGKIIKQ